MGSKTPRAPSALLLLSAPSSSSSRPPSLQILKEAFEPALSAVFTHLNDQLNVSGSNESAAGTARLDIAVSIPGLWPSSGRSRARIFGPLQQLLAGVYKLVGAVSAAKRIELDAPGGIDVRAVFTFDHHRESTTSTTNTTASSRSPLRASPGQDSGPLLELRTLASSGRSWDMVFHVNTQEGKDLMSAFAADLDYTPTSQAVPGGAGSSSFEAGVLPPSLAEPSSSALHYSVAVGGTFDHLHIGHKLLLTATALALDSSPTATTTSSAASISSTPECPPRRLITVGVTGDELLVKKKYAEYLESWDVRSENTLSFLTSIIDFSPASDTQEKATENEKNSKLTTGSEENGKRYILQQLDPNLTIKIVQLSDPFGPTITDETISALVVSKETRSGGRAVNEERKKKGWQALDVFEVDVLRAGEVVEAFLLSSATTRTSDFENEDERQKARCNEMGDGVVDKESFESKISSTDIRRRRMQKAQEREREQEH